MSEKEATSRIKINRLLEAAGWRFFADENGSANIYLEPKVMLTKQAVDDFGENFEKVRNGFVDFLLLDEKGFPLLVLEAKSEDKNPLVGKEQARKYAKSQNCRFVILSNGNLHYFWDLERGNPSIITSFPTQASIANHKKTSPNPQRLVDEIVSEDYVAITQRPNYTSEAAWKNENERVNFVEKNNLRFLRPYQKNLFKPFSKRLQKVMIASFSKWQRAPEKHSLLPQSSNFFFALEMLVACYFWLTA
jgi:type I restriction enzyme R subunit